MAAGDTVVALLSLSPRFIFGYVDVAVAAGVAGGGMCQGLQGDPVWVEGQSDGRDRPQPLYVSVYREE